MVINILYIFVFFFEMLISTIFFSSISDKKKPMLAIIIFGTFVFEIGAIINIFLISTVWVNVLFSLIANLCISNFGYKIKNLRSVFYSLLLVAISTFIEVIVVLIISSFTKLYIIDYESKPILLVVEIIISKILYFLIAMILLKFSQKDNKIVKVPTTFYIFPLITLVTVICFWYISLNEYIEYRNQIILGVVSILLFLATTFVFFSFQANAQKENKLLLLQQEQDKIKTDMIYYDILEQQNNNLRIYTHDAKNHLSAIKNLNTNPQIESYISEMIECLEEYSKVCHSGNRVLDVIIDKYVTECSINDIVFDFDIKNNNLSNIEYYDIATILGNLLDNAVEAVGNLEKKQISFETDYRNNFSVIIVSNSCYTSPIFDSNGIPITTKSNKRLHGFGLKSVRKTIKKYNGDISFDYDSQKKIFIVTIMLDI